MPSTDIDGEPILILNRRQAAKIVGMAQRLGRLYADETALVNLITETFPPNGDRDLRVGYHFCEGSHRISYFNSAGNETVLCRIRDSRLDEVKSSFDALLYLGTAVGCTHLESPATSSLKSVLVPAHIKLPDTPQVRYLIEEIKLKLSS